MDVDIDMDVDVDINVDVDVDVDIDVDADVDEDANMSVDASVDADVDASIKMKKAGNISQKLLNMKILFQIRLIIMETSMQIYLKTYLINCVKNLLKYHK